MARMKGITIIIPCLDEAETIGAALQALAPLRERHTEVIVVDGGSTDGTPERARGCADRVISAPRGRALQMNRGAGLASRGILLFLHADSRLPPDADTLIERALAEESRVWGRFDVTIASTRPLLRLTAALMNLRSRLTSVATGDQGIFVRQSAFARVGGYPPIGLMEDIALSRMLKKISRPVCLKPRITTSARRWEKHGIVRTILLMWGLRLAYFLGAHPDRLAARYATHK
jgi:rSAM/selenodomain-associated transferase 2